MSITQTDKDALLSTVTTLTTQVNALVVDAGPTNPTVTLTANPISVPAGSPSTLDWTSTDAVVAIDQGIGAVAPSGSQQVSPAATTTYTATATGAAGTTPATAPATVTVTVAPPRSGPLANLASGKVWDLGPYADTSIPYGENITDDSGFVIGPDGKIYMRGGGHGPYNGTTLRIFDTQIALQWSSRHPSKPYPSMLYANWDIPFGRWDNNHPNARHTYNQQVILVRRYYCMAWYGMAYHPAGSPDSARIEYNVNPGGRIFWHDLDGAPDNYTYSNIPFASYPWSYDIAASPDEISGRILIAGSPRTYSNLLGLWQYDPATDTQSLIKQTSDSCGPNPDLVYIGGNRWLVIQGRSGATWEFVYNRANPTASTLTKWVVTGAPNQVGFTLAPNAFGFDALNQVVGGYVINGKINYLDIATKAWETRQLLNEDGGNATMSQANHCFDTDPISGCSFFLSRPPPFGTAHTFACRF